MRRRLSIIILIILVMGLALPLFGCVGYVSTGYYRDYPYYYDSPRYRYYYYDHSYPYGHGYYYYRRR